MPTPEDYAPDRNDERMAILKDILDHVQQYGYKRWDLVLARWPDVSRSTIFRRIADVRDGNYDKTEVMASAVKKAMHIAAKAGVSQHLPASPAPAMLTPENNPGRKVEKSINFMSMIRELLDDAAMLREWSTTEKDGRRVIKNPQFFAQAMKLKLGILETGLRAHAEIYNADKMQEFYDTIMQTIGETSPEVRDEIVKRLKALNDAKGITVAAVPADSVIEG